MKGFLHSLLDFDIDNEYEFGIEAEDPFVYDKQKILDDILMETQYRDMKRKQRNLSTDTNFWLNKN